MLAVHEAHFVFYDHVEFSDYLQAIESVSYTDEEGHEYSEKFKKADLEHIKQVLDLKVPDPLYPLPFYIRLLRKKRQQAADKYKTIGHAPMRVQIRLRKLREIVDMLEARAEDEPLTIAEWYEIIEPRDTKSRSYDYPYIQIERQVQLEKQRLADKKMDYAERQKEIRTLNRVLWHLETRVGEPTIDWEQYLRSRNGARMEHYNPTVMIQYYKIVLNSEKRRLLAPYTIPYEAMKDVEALPYDVMKDVGVLERLMRMLDEYKLQAILGEYIKPKRYMDMKRTARYYREEVYPIGYFERKVMKKIQNIYEKFPIEPYPVDRAYIHRLQVMLAYMKSSGFLTYTTTEFSDLEEEALIKSSDLPRMLAITEIQKVLEKERRYLLEKWKNAELPSEVEQHVGHLGLLTRYLEGRKMYDKDDTNDEMSLEEYEDIRQVLMKRRMYSISYFEKDQSKRKKWDRAKWGENIPEEEKQEIYVLERMIQWMKDSGYNYFAFDEIADIQRDIEKKIKAETEAMTSTIADV